MSDGTEFRDDARARQRPLSAERLAELTTLRDGPAVFGVAMTVGTVFLAVAAALTWWTPWVVLPAMVLITTRQQAFFVLAHDAAHYRLFSSRRANEWVGRALASTVGISMCSYRVIHRLHHNDLYGDTDPDIPLHGGYPRGRVYLLKKLGRDLIGLTAPKAYSYFFGAPALNVDANGVDAKGVGPRRPLDDTAPALRYAALADRRMVVCVQVALALGALASGYWLEYLVLWIVPAVTMLQAVLRLRAVLEHGAVTDYRSPLTAARTNLGPRWLLWLLFPHHVNFHIAHHVYPAIPHYNLPAAHAALAEAGALDGAEVCRVGQSLKRIFAPREVPVASAPA